MFNESYLLCWVSAVFTPGGVSFQFKLLCSVTNVTKNIKQLGKHLENIKATDDD